MLTLDMMLLRSFGLHFVGKPIKIMVMTDSFWCGL